MTGVQTCALPICFPRQLPLTSRRLLPGPALADCQIRLRPHGRAAKNQRQDTPEPNPSVAREGYKALSDAFVFMVAFLRLSYNFHATLLDFYRR